MAADSASRSATAPSGDHGSPLAAAHDLCRFIDASPSPYHAVAEVAARLAAAGFEELDETEAWAPGPGGRFVRRGGTLVGWWAREPGSSDAGFRIVGAHTDSPNLRIKPRPDAGAFGYRQLAVEVYGGALRNSWLDRDLGISGRVTVRDGGPGGIDTRLVRIDRPLARIPQLAIHLDRTANEGLTLNPQQHLVPVWGLGAPHEGMFRGFLAGALGVAEGEVLGWDAMFHDLTPSTLLGRGDELVSAPRIDNLLSCHAATEALVAVAAAASPPPGVSVICLFDHEEVGSTSASGADSTVLATILERIAALDGLDREGYLRALARSRCASADGAHATHPNYGERHEPGHHIAIDGGPVLKHNANVRYASDATSGAWFRLACEAAGVPCQEFVVRSDLPCGSTIGPVTAARLGIPTVDVGIAQLAMHSARELCGAEDVGRFAPALAAFLLLG